MRFDVRSGRWSRVLLILGGVGLFLTGIVGYLNSVLVNGENFAEILNEVRQDDAVTQQVGEQVALAAVDAEPDLVAVQPALAAGAAAVVGSPILDGVFTPAVSSFHEAMTEEGAKSAVLTLADLGATITTALETFAPDIAADLPSNLNVTLAEVGGQEGVAARIIPAIQLVSTLAWLIPLVTLLLLVGAIWLAPRRRMALVTLGWAFVIVGAVLGALALLMNIASLLLRRRDPGRGGRPGRPPAVQPAVGGALHRHDGRGRAVHRRRRRPAAAGERRPPDQGGPGPARPPSEVPASGRWFARSRSSRWARSSCSTPRSAPRWSRSSRDSRCSSSASPSWTWWRRTNGLPTSCPARRWRLEGTADTEAEPPPSRRPRTGMWLIPVAAGVTGVIVVAALILPQHLPQAETTTQDVAADTTGCNGHDELCDKRFDEVVIAASHNSMSVADGTWYLAEQPKDMVSSLDDGIRGLLVDTWYGQPAANGRAITADRSVAAAEQQLLQTHGPEVVASVRRTIDRVRNTRPTGPVAPYFCHTVCELGATAMAPEMARLNTWMDAHPREVVVMFIQDTVTPQDTDAVLRAAGLAEKAYAHPAGAQWPTLGQMIESNKRLLVLMENHGGGAELPYLHQGFDLVQDTEYTFDTAADFTCTLKRGQPDSPLFNINHWLASFAKLVSNAEQVNAYDVLKARVDDCRDVRGRTPTMISVNWYDHGDLFRVVDELNGVEG